jgi:hypothetical protein
MTEQAAPMVSAGPVHRSRFHRLTAKYKEDHQNPVNNFLHVGVGWPLAAAAVILLPFKPLWGMGLFILAYVIMFAGHFLFEKNIPTVLRHPSTPFVMAWSVIRGIGEGATRLMRRRQASE